MLGIKPVLVAGKTSSLPVVLFPVPKFSFYFLLRTWLAVIQHVSWSFFLVNAIYLLHDPDTTTSCVSCKHHEFEIQPHNWMSFFLTKNTCTIQAFHCMCVKGATPHTLLHIFKQHYSLAVTMISRKFTTVYQSAIDWVHESTKNMCLNKPTYFILTNQSWSHSAFSQKACWLGPEICQEIQLNKVSNIFMRNLLTSQSNSYLRRKKLNGLLCM